MDTGVFSCLEVMGKARNRIFKKGKSSQKIRRKKQVSGYPGSKMKKSK